MSKHAIARQYLLTHKEAPIFIVGRSGAGKTTFLQELTHELPHVVMSNEPPSPATIGYIDDFVANLGSQSTWAAVWDRALLCALFSSAPREFQNRIQALESIVNIAPYLPSAPIDVCAALDRLVRIQLSQSHMVHIIGQDAWEALRRELVGVPRRVPIHFAVDTIAGFQRDSFAVLAAQRGLMEMALHWNEGLTHRSRLTVACSAENVPPRLLRHPAATQTLHLEWSPSELLEYGSGIWKQRTTVEPSNHAAWWLRTAINASTQVPRDVLEFVTLTQQISLPGAAQALASSLARRLFSSAAAEIAASSGAGPQDSSAGVAAGSSVLDSQYARNIPIEQLETLVRLSIDSGGRVELSTLESYGHRIFRVDILDILWRHGLMGLMRDDSPIVQFYAARDSQNRLMDSSSRVLMHPSIVTYLSGNLDQFSGYEVRYGEE